MYAHAEWALGEKTFWYCWSRRSNDAALFHPSSFPFGFLKKKKKKNKFSSQFHFVDFSYAHIESLCAYKLCFYHVLDVRERKLCGWVGHTVRFHTGFMLNMCIYGNYNFRYIIVNLWGVCVLMAVRQWWWCVFVSTQNAEKFELIFSLWFTIERKSLTRQRWLQATRIAFHTS